MSERTLVPILVFWAFLAIITPTLVLLSENSKPDFHLYGNTTDGVNDRRMKGHIEHPLTKATPSMTVVAAEELTPAPALAPTVSLGTGANLTVPHHNHTLRSNKSNHGLPQVFPRKQLKQTKLRFTSS